MVEKSQQQEHEETAWPVRKGGQLLGPRPPSQPHPESHQRQAGKQGNVEKLTRFVIIGHQPRITVEAQGLPQPREERRRQKNRAEQRPYSMDIQRPEPFFGRSSHRSIKYAFFHMDSTVPKCRHLLLAEASIKKDAASAKGFLPSQQNGSCKRTALGWKAKTARPAEWRHGLSPTPDRRHDASSVMLLDRKDKNGNATRPSIAACGPPYRSGPARGGSGKVPTRDVSFLSAPPSRWEWAA